MAHDYDLHTLKGTLTRKPTRGIHIRGSTSRKSAISPVRLLSLSLWLLCVLVPLFLAVSGQLAIPVALGISGFGVAILTLLHLAGKE